MAQWNPTNVNPLAFLERTHSVWFLAAVVSEVVLVQLLLSTVVGLDFWSSRWLHLFTIYGANVWDLSVAYVLAPGAHLTAAHYQLNLAGLIAFGILVADAHDNRTVYAAVLGGIAIGVLGFSVLHTVGWLDGMAALGASAGVYSLLGCLAVTSQLAPRRLPGGTVWGSSRLGRAWVGLCFALLLAVEIAGTLGLPQVTQLGIATGGSEVHVLGYLTGAVVGAVRT